MWSSVFSLKSLFRTNKNTTIVAFPLFSFSILSRFVWDKFYKLSLTKMVKNMENHLILCNANSTQAVFSVYKHVHSSTMVQFALTQTSLIFPFWSVLSAWLHLCCWLVGAQKVRRCGRSCLCCFICFIK